MKTFEYRGSRFAIMSPKTVQDMIEEAHQQSNCLVSYVQSVTDGDCMIFFLRQLADPEKSYVTIEIRSDGSLGQVKAKFNKAPAPEAGAFVRKWYDTIVQPTLAAEALGKAVV